MLLLSACLLPYKQADLAEIQEPRLLVDVEEELRWPALPLPGEGVETPREAASEAAVVVDLSSYGDLPPRPGGERNVAGWLHYLREVRGLRPERIFALKGPEAQPSTILAAIQTAGEMTSSGGVLWIIVVGYGVSPVIPSSPEVGGFLLTYGAPKERPIQKGHAVPVLAMTEELVNRSEAPAMVILDVCGPPEVEFAEAMLEGVEPRLYGTSSEPPLIILPTLFYIEVKVRNEPGLRSVRGSFMTSGLGDRCLATLPGGNRPALSYLALGAVQGWADDGAAETRRARPWLDSRFFAGDQRIYAIEALDFLGSITTSITDYSRELPPRLLGLGRRRMVLAHHAGASAPTIEALLGEPPEPGLAADAGAEASARTRSFRFAGGARIHRPPPLSGWRAQSPAAQAEIAPLLAKAGDASAAVDEIKASWCHLRSKDPGIDALVDHECTRWRRYLRRWRAFHTVLDDDHRVLLRMLNRESRAVGVAALRSFLHAYAEYADHPRVRAADAALSAHVRGEEPQIWRRLAEFGRGADVDGGRYFRGCTDADDLCEEDETPQMRTLSGYRVDRQEVARRDYDHCVAAGACTSVKLEGCYGWTGEGFDPGASLPEAFNRPRSPQVCVTWAQAQDYCEWLGKRLPTELEWEVAARGGDRRIYPWGDEEPDCASANHSECGRLPWDVDVATSREDVFGLLHMAGNVGEWVQDHYRKNYRRTRQRNPVGAFNGSVRGIRGGSFYDPPEFIRASYRYALTPDYGYATVGFRCVAD